MCYRLSYLKFSFWGTDELSDYKTVYFLDIGRALLQRVIAEARAQGAARLHLAAGSFVPSVYARSNVQMEMLLISQG